MLMLLIVTSGLFVSSCADVDFSFSKTCFSKGGDLELSAKYTGSGTVTAVEWYYSGQVGSNLIVLASTCAIVGAPDPGYPDTSRMNFTCPATNTFTLTLKGLLEDELKKSWGATFSLSSGNSPTTAQEPIQICTATTPPTNCTCECKCKCKRIVIPSIVFGSLGMINLPVVIGGTVTEHFGRTTALIVDFIGIVCDVTSFVLGTVVQIIDCCEDCCEDSDCCECERNWIENTGAAFIAIGALVGIVAGAIFYLIWSNRMGPGNNAYKAKEAKDPGENHGMTGTSM